MGEGIPVVVQVRGVLCTYGTAVTLCRLVCTGATAVRADTFRVSVNIPYNQPHCREKVDKIMRGPGRAQSEW